VERMAKTIGPHDILFGMPFHKVNEEVIHDVFSTYINEEMTEAQSLIRDGFLNGNITEEVMSRFGANTLEEFQSKVGYGVKEELFIARDKFIEGYRQHKTEAGWFAYAHSYALWFAEAVTTKWIKELEVPVLAKGLKKMESFLGPQQKW
jgi:hypothetical protein